MDYNECNPEMHGCVKCPKIIINFNKCVYCEKNIKMLPNIDNKRVDIFFKRVVKFILNIFAVSVKSKFQFVRAA